MMAVRPPCLSGAAPMFMRGSSLDGSAAATFKRGGGHVREGCPLQSPATRVEAGWEGLRGGLFRPGPAGDFPGHRPWLLGPGSGAGVPGGGCARPFPALAALPTDAVLGGPGPGLHGEPGPRGNGRGVSRRELRGRPPSGGSPALARTSSQARASAPQDRGPRTRLKPSRCSGLRGRGRRTLSGRGDTSLRSRGGPPPGTTLFLIRDAGTTRSSQINDSAVSFCYYFFFFFNR